MLCLCAKFKNIWPIRIDVMDKQGAAKFEFKMILDGYSIFPASLQAAFHFQTLH